MMSLWIKAAHVIAAVIWVSGLFSLTVGGYDSSSRKRILRVNGWIIAPAMVVAVGLGMTLAISGGWIAAKAIWLFLKVLLVTAMLALHGFLSGTLVRAEKGRETAVPPRQTTIIIWVLAIVAILFLAEVKPL